MTRDEHRAKCIEAATEAILLKRYGLREIRHNGDIVKITREEATAGFDALHGIARVNIPEATEQLENSARGVPLVGEKGFPFEGRSFPELTYRLAVFNAMSSAGDLTNEPEKADEHKK